MEEDLNRRQPQWKMTSMEDDLNVRQTSKLCNKLGPAQLVLYLNRFCIDLRRSGHQLPFRRVILKKVIQKYKTDLSNYLEGDQRM